MAAPKAATPEVFDLDALQAEASGEPFRFRLAGEEFSLPPIVDIDRKDLSSLIRSFGEGLDVDAGLAKLFGDQWERFDALPLTVHQLNGLLEAYQSHQGVSMGESEASTGS